MKKAVSLGSLLVLGSAWIIQSSPETLILTQNDFDLGRFMGRWYELAVVSTCPHYMNRKRGDPVVIALELQHVAPEHNFTVTAQTFRNGTCKQTSTPYSLTDRPGRFYHYIPRFRADVYSHVVHVNYEEYAMMLLLSTEQPSGNKTTTLKLYSRAVDVSPAVLDNFKAFVRQHRMSDDSIIINHKKEECPSIAQETELNTQPQMSVPKGSNRNNVPPVKSDNV